MNSPSIRIWKTSFSQFHGNNEIDHKSNSCKTKAQVGLDSEHQGLSENHS